MNIFRLIRSAMNYRSFFPICWVQLLTGLIDQAEKFSFRIFQKSSKKNVTKMTYDFGYLRRFLIYTTWFKNDLLKDTSNFDLF